MRVAALYDIHGNLPALEAVLAEVEADLIVIGGDVASGPMPREVLARLAELRDVRFVMGNADREVVKAFDAGREGEDMDTWTARQIGRTERDALAGYERTVTVDVEGLGPVLFCHGSPRSDTEMVTTLSPEERLAPMAEGVAEATIVLGHTHGTFDRTAAGKRWVNAGSVGLPYEGDAAAFWALLGPDVELKRTPYDVEAATRLLSRSGMPGLDDLLGPSLVAPVPPEEVARHFEGLGDYQASSA